ncbi:MAG: hypothetical protein ACKPB4_06450, partial [Sphaerospermopsis kisseleviana]
MPLPYQRTLRSSYPPPKKALSDAEIREVVAQGARSYAQQITRFANGGDHNFALTLDNTKGPLRQVLYSARQLTRV